MELTGFWFLIVGPVHREGYGLVSKRSSQKIHHNTGIDTTTITIRNLKLHAIILVVSLVKTAF